jgi:hypothetical protein
MTSSLERDGNVGPALAHSESASKLFRARGEALNVVQWLARVAHSYVMPLERRSELDFRAEDTAFVTKTFANGVALEMRLPELHLQFLHQNRRVPHLFDPQGRSPAEAEAWILVELLHRGIDREKFSTQLPYTVPGLLAGDAEDYSPQACREGLLQLAEWCGTAAAVLTEAGRAEGVEKPTVTCLPRTLDLAVELSPRGKPFALKFSSGDAQYPAPFFYLESKAALAQPEHAIVSASALLADNTPADAAARLLDLALKLRAS